MPVEPISNPIFLLGVGRCGSTFQQVHLSRLSDVWIWGEHGGTLRGLCQWADDVKGHPLLQHYAFAREEGDARHQLEGFLKSDPTMTAWMNGFRARDIDDVLRQVISTLMTRELPQGKRRWGFKEINYGLEDDVPARLLELFGEARVIHTLRHPFKTVESSIFAWNGPDLMQAVDALDFDTVDKLYYYFLQRWLALVRYLSDLESRFPGRVFASRIEAFRAQRARLLEFLQIEDKEATPNLEPINAGEEIAKSENAEYVEALASRRSRFISMAKDTAASVGYDLGAPARR